MVRTVFATAFLLCAAIAAGAETATVTAVHATETGAAGKSFDAKCAEFKESLGSLEFDAFTTVKQQSAPLDPEAATEVRINERYTLRLSEPMAQSDGHIKCKVEVFGLPRNAKEPVKVVEMTARLAPEKPVMIRGLRMDEGEIVVILERS